MLWTMRVRSAIWHRLATGVIPVAFLAALPLVQMCSLCIDPADSRCLVVAGEGRSTIGDQTFEWSQHDVFTIPHWTFARHEARGGDADLFMVTDKSAFERLDLVREELE